MSAHVHTEREGNGIVPTTGDSLVDATATAKTNAPLLSNERAPWSWPNITGGEER